MDLSISIVSWNTKDLLDQCLRSIYDGTRGIKFEIIVVDNASSDDSPHMVLRKYPQVRLIQNDKNVGFAKANNQAYEISCGRHFLLLNPDTIVHDGALKGLVEFLDEHPEVGAVGPLVLNADGSLQYSWAKFPTFFSEVMGKLDRRIGPSGYWPSTVEEVQAVGPFEVDWIGGCCFMIRRSAVEQIGLMDESLFMYCEETDWCKRLSKAGWSLQVFPKSTIVHLGGKSSEQVPDMSRRHLRLSKSKFFCKHHGFLLGMLLDYILRMRDLMKSILKRHLLIA